MRLGAILGGSLVVVLGAVALFSACSGVTHDPRRGPPAASARAQGGHASIAPPAPADAGVLDDAAATATVAVPRDCADPQAAILNHPDGGVVFNNAMTSADAGFIDRSQGVIDALGSEAHAFRCCFDPWVRAHPEEVGTMLLRVTLAGDGRVLAAEIAGQPGDLEDEPTHACVLAVAHGASYPRSPTAKETTVEYPFRVGLLGR